MCVVSWSAIGRQCRVGYHKSNKFLLDWFKSGLPVTSIQGHAVISGDLMYTKNILVPKMKFDYDALDKELLTTAEVGTVFINVSRGIIGTIMLKYSSDITEDMPYPVIGKIDPRDLTTLREVGDIVWDGYYNSKKYYQCSFERGI